jgi:hypothetical protein
MLRRIDPEEIILALKPLLVNTPRSPRTADTPTAIATPEDIGRYLDDVQKRMTWVTCPDCSTEWNALTHEGICASCVEARGGPGEKTKRTGRVSQTDDWALRHRALFVQQFRKDASERLRLSFVRSLRPYTAKPVFVRLPGDRENAFSRRTHERLLREKSLGQMG